MTVSVSANVVPPSKPIILDATISLSGYDLQVLRSMLGGLSRAERRAATRRNGGSKAAGDRARFLVKELIDAIDAQVGGDGRLTEVPVTPPDQKANKEAGLPSGYIADESDMDSF